MKYLIAFVLAALVFAVEGQFRGQQSRPAGGAGGQNRLPDYPELCNTLRNPARVRQYVNCALDVPGACQTVAGDVNDYRNYLKANLPSALGRGRCTGCAPGDQVKLAFFAKEFRQRYKAETSQLLNKYRDEVARAGGLKAQTPADLVGAPAGC